MTVEVSMVTCILKQSLSEGSASLTILLTGALFLLGRKGRPELPRILASADSSAHPH